MTLVSENQVDLFKPWSTFSESLSSSEDQVKYRPVGNAVLPAINVSETSTLFILEVAAPGMERQCFAVRSEDGVLHIEFKRQEQIGGELKHYTRKEYSYSAFSRSFKIPKHVALEDIDILCANGILSITIPKY